MSGLTFAASPATDAIATTFIPRARRNPTPAFTPAPPLPAHAAPRAATAFPLNCPCLDNPTATLPLVVATAAIFRKVSPPYSSNPGRVSQ